MLADAFRTRFDAFKLKALIWIGTLEADYNKLQKTRIFAIRKSARWEVADGWCPMVRGGYTTRDTIELWWTLFVGNSVPGLVSNASVSTFIKFPSVRNAFTCIPWRAIRYRSVAHKTYKAVSRAGSYSSTQHFQNTWPKPLISKGRGCQTE
jgi:hypothetical protein